MQLMEIKLINGTTFGKEKELEVESIIKKDKNKESGKCYAKIIGSI